MKKYYIYYYVPENQLAISEFKPIAMKTGVSKRKALVIKRNKFFKKLKKNDYVYLGEF